MKNKQQVNYADVISVVKLVLIRVPEAENFLCAIEYKRLNYIHVFHNFF